MKLTALDIRKQEFSRTLRGYDPDEVESFIEVISDQWKEMVDELKRDNDRISQLELKLEHYHKVEEALEEALQTARTSARQTIVQADVKAKKIIEAAEEDAEKITRDARDHRQEIKREAAKFSVRRKEIVAKLRAFLLSEMEMLAHYDDDDPTGFIRLLGDASGVDTGNQPKLTAGSPTSDALDADEADRQSGQRTVTPAPEPQTAESDVEYAEAEPAPEAEAEYEYDEAESYGESYAESYDESYDESYADPYVDDHTEQTTQESRTPVQPQAAEQTQAARETRPERATEPSSNNNDSFHSEYERMASIEDVYGQFDPDASDDDYKGHDEHPREAAGDGYADSVQGTTRHGHEYPNQSRPAEDRPPADSPAASGRRAPGMNRPDAYEDLSESATEDIEKIRRILEDLDN